MVIIIAWRAGGGTSSGQRRQRVAIIDECGLGLLNWSIEL